MTLRSGGALFAAKGDGKGAIVGKFNRSAVHGSYTPDEAADDFSWTIGGNVVVDPDPTVPVLDMKAVSYGGKPPEKKEEPAGEVDFFGNPNSEITMDKYVAMDDFAVDRKIKNFAPRMPFNIEAFSPGRLAHLGAVLVMAVPWLVLRRRELQRGTLRAVDAGCTLGCCLLLTLDLGMNAARYMPDLILVIVVDKASAANIARFEREVRLTAGLSHPNRIAIYDYGRTADGTFYYAMEYLDGLTLDALVAADGPQEPGRVVHILRQICAALAEAHGVGLIHRDIRPANIVLCERGGDLDVVKVLDFGLVKQLQTADEPQLSQAHTMAGTPLTMAPEAIRDPVGVDSRADLYAVGAVGYYLLTGSHVFAGTTPIELCMHHLQTAPTPPSERLGRAVDAELEALILRCLAKAPDERPAGAAEIAQHLALSSLSWTLAVAEASLHSLIVTTTPSGPAAMSPSALKEVTSGSNTVTAASHDPPTRRDAKTAGSARAPENVRWSVPSSDTAR